MTLWHSCFVLLYFTSFYGHVWRRIWIYLVLDRSCVKCYRVCSLFSVFTVLGFFLIFYFKMNGQIDQSQRKREGKETCPRQVGKERSKRKQEPKLIQPIEEAEDQNKLKDFGTIKRAGKAWSKVSNPIYADCVFPHTMMVSITLKTNARNFWYSCSTNQLLGKITVDVEVFTT